MHEWKYQEAAAERLSPGAVQRLRARFAAVLHGDGTVTSDYRRGDAGAVRSVDLPRSAQAAVAVQDTDRRQKPTVGTGWSQSDKLASLWRAAVAESQSRCEPALRERGSGNAPAVPPQPRTRGSDCSGEEGGGGGGGSGGGGGDAAAAAAADEDGLYVTPDHLQERLLAKSAVQGKEIDDAQRWLAGIMEVPIGAEEKMEAIEQTELAKRKLMAQEAAAGRRGGGPQLSIPANFNANFHQHRRDAAQLKRDATKHLPKGPAAAAGTQLDVQGPGGT